MSRYEEKNTGPRGNLQVREWRWNRRVGAAAAGSGEGGVYWFKVGMVVSGPGRSGERF